MNCENIRRVFCYLAVLTLVLCLEILLNGQQAQKGVNVRLATTESALPIATADEPKALMITITAEGTTYLGMAPVTPGALTEELTRSNRAQKLFIKADASALYGAVENALNAARSAGFSECIFLTAQFEMPSGGRILPKGIEVSLKARAKGKTPRLELTKSAGESPSLKINQRPVPWASLQNTLTMFLGSQIDRKVLIKADDAVPFEQVMHAVDVSNSIGAEVILTSQP